MKQAILALMLASAPTLVAAAPMFTYRFVPSAIFFNPDPFFVGDSLPVAPAVEAEITFSRLGPTTAYHLPDYELSDLGTILDFRISFGDGYSTFHITPEIAAQPILGDPDAYVNIYHASFDVGPQSLIGTFHLGNGDGTDQWEGGMGVEDIPHDVHGAVWFISHGTDGSSACYGPQNPGGSACVAVGDWVRVRGRGVPEPAAATLLLIGLLGAGAVSVLRQAPQCAQRST
jgi:hypothetical protein